MVPLLRYAPGLQQRSLAVVVDWVSEPLLELIRLTAVAERVCSLDEAQVQETGRWPPLRSVPVLLGVMAAQPLLMGPTCGCPTSGGPPGLSGSRPACRPAKRRSSASTGRAPPPETTILRGRSWPLAELAPLAKTKGIEYASLQKGFDS